MAKKTTAPAKVKGKEKRAYSMNVREKIKSGKVWVLSFTPDPDVAEKLIAESETIPSGYRAYTFLLNNRLRKAYGIKAKKK